MASERVGEGGELRREKFENRLSERGRLEAMVATRQAKRWRDFERLPVDVGLVTCSWCLRHSASPTIGN